MLIYTTTRNNHWPYILKEWAKSVGVVSLVIFLGSFFISIKGGTYWYLAGLLIFWFVNIADKRRVYKIAIDEEAHTITQYYRNPFGGEGEKIHTLDKVQMYVASKASSAAGGVTTQNIELYKNWRVILELDTKKDGFSPSTLQEIRKTLEQMLVPVTG